MDRKVAQIGNGFVGNALHRSFEQKGLETVIYDKYQKIGSIDAVFESDILFLCLPTPYVLNKGFDLSPIEENLKILSEMNYAGLCVVKSTVEIGVTKALSKRYKLNIAHNPEFLTERTAYEDFHNQSHIVLGKSSESKEFSELILLYKELYPNAKLSICTSDESEAMKIFCNNFYAAKVMIFNELFSLSEKTGINFERVKQLMLENGWINPMHTSVPGPDGKFAYGGNCFVKDTHALVNQMQKLGSLSEVFEAVVSERNSLRSDMPNINEE
jgi:nucleotide sugar dehydrogenase